MEVHTDIPIKHFENLERHEPVVLDNSNIKEYKLCPRRYFFNVVLGYKPNTNPPYFPFGTAYHLFRERLEIHYQKFVADGQPKQVAIALSLGNSMKDALDSWTTATKKNPPDYSEKGNGKFDHITFERLKLACENTFKYWTKEKESNNVEVLATEQAFTVQLPSGDWFGGRADQLIRANGKIRGRDFKTTTKAEIWYRRSFNPNSQFAGYTYAESIVHGQPVRGQIVEVLYNLKSSEPKLVPYPVDFTKEQLSDWEAGTMEWLSRIRKSRETDFYPMNEEHCGFCPFHQVCQMPSEISRQSVLKSMYVKRIWDHQNPEE